MSELCLLFVCSSRCTRSRLLVGYSSGLTPRGRAVHSTAHPSRDLVVSRIERCVRSNFDIKVLARCGAFGLAGTASLTHEMMVTGCGTERFRRWFSVLGTGCGAQNDWRVCSICMDFLSNSLDYCATDSYARCLLPASVPFCPV
jgi:hypothetical protein